MQTTQQAMVSSHRLTHLAEELARASGSATAVGQALEAAGLTEGDLGREGHRIDAAKEAQFLQAAVTQVGDTSFAAKAGLHFEKNTGIPSYVANYSQTLGDALRNAERYTVLTDGHFGYVLRSSSNAASILLRPKGGYLEFGDRVREFIIFAIIAIMRSTTRREVHPLEIRFRHDAPANRQTIARLAGGTVIYNAEETEIIVAPATLDLPVPTFDPSLLRYLKDYGDGLVARLNAPEPNLRARIEAMLINALPERLLQAPEVAERLGMSPRTLARRLSDTGLSFTGIADALRCKLARTYLAQSDTPISEIAFLLNYADQASFSTAFKRWTGDTPKMFRDHTA